MTGTSGQPLRNGVGSPRPGGDQPFDEPFPLPLPLPVPFPLPVGVGVGVTVHVAVAGSESSEAARLPHVTLYVKVTSSPAASAWIVTAVELVSPEVAPEASFPPVTFHEYFDTE